jgi:hypothetical protein
MMNEQRIQSTYKYRTKQQEYKILQLARSITSIFQQSGLLFYPRIHSTSATMAPPRKLPGILMPYNDYRLSAILQARETGGTNYTMVFGVCGVLVAAAALVVAVLQLRRTRAVRRVYELA